MINEVLSWLQLQPITLAVIIAFLRQYGYWILFVGTLLEGEAVVIVAGALAHAGVLDLRMVIFISWLGSTLNDQVLYQLGCRFGERLLNILPRFLCRHINQAEGLIRRFGDWVTLLFRFIYGTRTITPILLGVHHYPVRRYLWMNPLAAAVWAMAIAGIGYVLGASLQSLLQGVQHVQIVLLLLLIVGAGGYWWWHRHGE
ncbi:SNARE associated protein [Acidithiobacillus ferrivorans]|uniref:SNARE associated protein n=1 Tax=Acidithiobacillus ferrivorans TaxID=160808 RepID=A0A060US22_9PROT|nr:DedA family protein [Acidithiobacillus ferrivorans]CDQ11412.1 SNARE associated protein [Acidithiobacillus ferrivorans]SMH67772.1 SNARE associated protein [Acidithiobacillus ferrivorans]